MTCDTYRLKTKDSVFRRGRLLKGSECASGCCQPPQALLCLARILPPTPGSACRAPSTELWRLAKDDFAGTKASGKLRRDCSPDRRSPTASLLTSLGIDRLSPGERLRLISEIWDSLPEQPPPELTDEQGRELDRRLALMDADPAALRSWAEVEARVLGRLRG